MATQAGEFIRDQNLNVHFDAVAPSGLKTNKPQKNGGFGGRKALGDISNSARPSTVQTSNKRNSKNVISFAEDFVPSKSKSFFGENKKVSKTGRKALGDLTNSIKPRVIKESMKVQGKKLSSVVEEQFPSDSVGIDEGFLHDHRECIKGLEKAKNMELDYFLKECGLDNSMQLTSPCVPPSSGKLKPESPISIQLMEELFETEMVREEPQCASPASPVHSFLWRDDDFLPISLKETP